MSNPSHPHRLRGFLLCVGFVFALVAGAAERKPNLVLILADDFGYDPAVTRSIARSMREGVVSSTTMIVNSPNSEDAARQADGLAIGLHLNLVRFPAVSDGSEQLDDAKPGEDFVVRATRARADGGRPRLRHATEATGTTLMLAAMAVPGVVAALG